MNPFRAIRRLFYVEHSAPEVEIDVEEARAAMLLFVRGGGAVSLSEWTALPLRMREILAEAGRSHRAETMAALVAALGSQSGLVDLLRNIGNGEPAEEAVAGLALEAAGARFLAGRVPLRANVGPTAPRSGLGSAGGGR